MNFPRNFLLFKRNISYSLPLFGVPLKKKPRVDPIILKMRMERKVKRLEGIIDKMEKQPKQLIPMLEYSLSPTVQKEMDIRVRKQIDEEIILKYNRMLKIWSLYKYIEAKFEARCLRKIFAAQQKALQNLHQLSPELWKEAVKKDPELIPYQSDHICKETPPNPDYVPPDGYRKEITKHWKL